MYTLSPFDDSNCHTCGVSLAYHVSRECINCRRPQVLIHKLQDYEVPQEFSSPELDEWFGPRWETEKPKRDVAERQEAERRRKEERYQRAQQAALSFLPEEYRSTGKNPKQKE